jgi:hypothetical protein
VFDNRVLRRIFKPKMDVVVGGLRKLHNEELCKENEMNRACSING